jgi:hypothetical protein
MMADLTVPLLIYGLSAGADVASTKYALQNPQNYESNPMAQGNRLYVRAAVGVAAATLLDVELQKRAPKWRFIPRIVVPLVSGIIAVHNVRQR